ncbi:hypothetical protein [Actinopolymorpha pittospori]
MAGDGITANALYPGGIRTKLQQYQEGPAMSAETRRIFDIYPWRSAEQGAATSVLLAASPLLEGIGGRYFENCQEALPYDPADESIEPSGVAAHALDPAAAERLWDVSLEMLAS